MDLSMYNYWRDQLDYTVGKEEAERLEKQWLKGCTDFEALIPLMKEEINKRNRLIELARKYFGR